MGKTIEQIVLRDEYIKDKKNMRSDEEFFKKWKDFDNAYTDGSGIVRWVVNDKPVYAKDKGK